MTSDKPAFKPPAGTPTSTSKAYDALLDPLPLPEVSESDGDTAWGLWEASVGGLMEEGKDSQPAAIPEPPGYEPTEPMGLDDEIPSDD